MLFDNKHKYFLAAIVESSQDSIVTINFDQIITSWNHSAELLYGYTAEQAIGQPLTSLLLPEDFVQLATNIELIRQGKVVKVFETERVHKDKSRILLEIVLSAVRDGDGEIIGISTIARDLTEFRKGEEAIREREVLAHVLDAQEAERGRIARDLHDELGQMVTSLRFLLRATKEACPDDATCSEISEMENIAQRIDESVDFIAWELRPAALDGVPLFAAIATYVKQWSQHTGVAATAVSSSLREARFSPETETAAYRIVQESLNNTRKHSGAKNAELIFEKQAGSVVLIIGDDGEGFDLEAQAKRAEGMGLAGMKERAAQIGATLEIETSPGEGTTVYLEIPVSGANGA